MKSFAWPVVGFLIASLVSAPAAAAERSAEQARGKAPVRPTDLVPVTEEEADAGGLAAMSKLSPPPGYEHRYLFLAAAIAGSLGGGLGYWSMAEARRANRLLGSNDASRVHATARASAAGAGVLISIAALCVGYGLFLEILPRDVSNAATLNFHF